MRSGLIALLTDFGYRDPYVGVMKGVIKSINPAAEIVDLTHGVTRHSIVEAAVVLLVSAKYFPRGTIFVVVVDPGVGSERRALVVETNNYILLGPDNGCLSLLAARDGVKRAFDISNTRFKLRDTSHTFHGRDVFAPVAAWISLGAPLEEVGVEVPAGSLRMLDIEAPRVGGDHSVEGSVIYIDVYGNIMTNIGPAEITEAGFLQGDKLKVVGPTGVTGTCVFTTSFSLVAPGELACYMNSWGYLEVAVNMGDAARMLGVAQGSRIMFAKAGHEVRSGI